jgi:hypothetical protein
MPPAPGVVQPDEHHTLRWPSWPGGLVDPTINARMVGECSDVQAGCRTLLVIPVPLARRMPYRLLVQPFPRRRWNDPAHTKFVELRESRIRGEDERGRAGRHLLYRCSIVQMFRTVSR